MWVVGQEAGRAQIETENALVPTLDVCLFRFVQVCDLD